MKPPRRIGCSVQRERAVTSSQVACKWLLEMNDDVSGSAVVDSVQNLVASKPAFFQSFSLIIATQLGREDLRAVCKLAWEANTPVVVRFRLNDFTCAIMSAARRWSSHTGCLVTCGWHRHCTLSTRASPTGKVRSRTPPSTTQYICICQICCTPSCAARRTDLRLSAPFPELLAVAEAYPWEGQDEAARKRRHDLPWPLILLEAAKRWKAENGGAAPKGLAGKSKFKALIQVSTPHRPALRVRRTTVPLLAGDGRHQL